MSDLQSLLMPAAVVVIAIAVLALLTMRNRSRKPAERVKPRGPANARYVCTKCSGEFLHSNRTISAWEKGSRRIFCDNCHKQWLSHQPKDRQQQSTSDSRSAPTPARRSTNRGNPQATGCLGVLVLLAVIPCAIFYAAYLA